MPIRLGPLLSAGGGADAGCRAPGRSLPREVSGQRTGADAASASVPVCTARPGVLPIRTLLTTVSASAMVRN